MPGWRFLLYFFVCTSIIINIVTVPETRSFKTLKLSVRDFVRPHALKNEPDIHNELIAYRAVGEKASYLQPIQASHTQAKNLPNNLIIAPGHYNVSGKIYDMREPGLYRFFLPEKINIQRIVLTKNEDAKIFISSIAWMHSHGNIDDGHTTNDLINSAKTRKIFLTCCDISGFSKNLLTNSFYDARVIEMSTLSKMNTYDNGHCMVEVYSKEKRHWELFDVDNGVYFTINDKILSFSEFSNALNNESYLVHKIDNDTKLDVSGFTENGYSYAFFSEGQIANLRDWYNRAAQVGGPLMGNVVYYTGKSKTERSEVTKRYPGYHFLSEKEFYGRFYSAAEENQQAALK